MNVVVGHDVRRAERISDAQRRRAAWIAERERIYREALDRADARLAASGPWRSVAPWHQPQVMAEADAARRAWEQTHPEPLPPQL